MKYTKAEETASKRGTVRGAIDKPIKFYKKKLLDLVKDFVKKRDNNICQFCEKSVSGSNCHVSHVIPVSFGNVLSFDPINMKVLCYHHHLNWWHKNPLESAFWFINKFPDRYKYLESKKKEKVNWGIEDYKKMIDKYI